MAARKAEVLLDWRVEKYFTICRVSISIHGKYVGDTLDGLRAIAEQKNKQSFTFIQLELNVFLFLQRTG